MQMKIKEKSINTFDSNPGMGADMCWKLAYEWLQIYYYKFVETSISVAACL